MSVIVGFGTLNLDIPIRFLPLLVLEGDFLGVFLLLPLGLLAGLDEFLLLQLSQTCHLLGIHAFSPARKISFHFAEDDPFPTSHSVCRRHPFTIHPNHFLVPSNEVNQGGEVGQPLQEVRCVL